MFKLNPTRQISLGLVFVTVSLLILADALNLIPGERRYQLDARQSVAEQIAIQTRLALTQTNDQFVQQFLEHAVRQNETIQSLAIRAPDGYIRFQTEGHEGYWGEVPPEASDPDKLILPLVGTDSGTIHVEVAFSPLKRGVSAYEIPRFYILLGFVALLGFAGYWFYLRRTLRQLDPSQVIPSRVKNVLNIMAEGVIITDRRGQILLVNETFIDLLGIPEEKLIGRKADSFQWKKDEEDERPYPWDEAQKNVAKTTNVNLRLVTDDDNTHIFNVNAVPILDERGASLGIISSFDNITKMEETNILLQEVMQNLVSKQKIIEQNNYKLNFLASRDPLTNCYNRRSLFEKMEAIFENESTSSKDCSVIMLDIDHFKRINDTYGHGVGDEVIKGVAHIVQQSVRGDDVVCRFGGEEFCVVLPGATAERALELAEIVRAKIESATFGDVTATCSFGASSLRFKARTPEALIEQADHALYKSKNDGRNRCSLWSFALENALNDTVQKAGA